MGSIWDLTTDIRVEKGIDTADHLFNSSEIDFFRHLYYITIFPRGYMLIPRY